MTIQKQVAHISLTGGLDTKTDDNLVLPGKLTVADNVEFLDKNTIQSRGGQVSLGAESTDVNQPIRLFEHKNTVHIESRPSATQGGIHRVNYAVAGPIRVENPVKTGSTWTSSAFRRASAETQRLHRLNRDVHLAAGYKPLADSRHDFAIVGGFSYYAFEEKNTIQGSYAVRVVVRNETSGIVQFTDLATDSSNIIVNPRLVVATGQPVYLYAASYTKGSKTWNLLKWTITTTAIGTPAVVTAASGGTGGNIEEAVNDTCMFDCCYSLNGTRIITVLRDSTAAGDKLKFNIVNSSDGASSVDSGTYTAANRVTSLCVLATGTTTLRAHCFWTESGLLTISAVARLYGSAAFTGASTVGTLLYGTGRLTAFYDATYSSDIWLVADDADKVTNTNLIVGRLRLTTFSETYGGLAEVTLRQTGSEFFNLFISGSPVLMQGRLYVPLNNLSAQFQTTSLLFDLKEFKDNGSTNPCPTYAPVLSRLDYGECFASPFNWGQWSRVPSTFAQTDRYIHYTYLRRETDLRLAGLYDETGVCIVRAKLDLDSQLGSAEANGIAFLAGACPHIYDGKQWFEEGFHYGPEIDADATVGASGYTLPAVNGDYDVCFTVAWQDNQGNWYESAPSNVVRFTVAGANRYIPVKSLVVPITYKAGYAVNMYRTPLLGNDTTLYLASRDIMAPTSFITSDTDLVQGETLYTTGDVLPNTPAPPCRHVTNAQGRFVLSGCGDGSKIFVSKPLQDGFGPEFAADDPLHSVRIPSSAGRAVATLELDGQLIVFGELGICSIAGNGPSVTGTQGGYSEAYVRSSGNGMDWDSPKSAVVSSDGIWFKRRAMGGYPGIRLFSRGGSIAIANGVELGSEVDSLLSGTIVATAPSDRNQFRFYQSSGTCLVLNENGQWTRWAGVGNIDACEASGPLGRTSFHLSVYQGDQPLLRYFSNDVNTDVDNDAQPLAAYVSTLKTGWLWLGGIQGFQRVYRLGLVLETNPVQNNLEYAINGIISYKNQAVTDTFTITSLTMNEHLLAYQKSTAVQVELNWSATDDSTPLKITDMTLLVGVKSNYNRLGFNRS